VVEWRAPLLCITEVSDSNLGPDKAHHDVDFLWFYTLSLGKSYFF